MCGRVRRVSKWTEAGEYDDILRPNTLTYRRQQHRAPLRARAFARPAADNRPPASAHHLVRQTICVAQRAGGVRCEVLAEPSNLPEQPDSALRPGKVCVAGLRQEPACRGAAVRCREAARLRSCHVRHEVFACIACRVKSMRSSCTATCSKGMRSKLANTGIAGTLERRVGGLQRSRRAPARSIASASSAVIIIALLLSYCA